MQKRFTFSEDEYNRILSDKDTLRKDNQELVKLVKQRELEMKNMKTKGDDVLVVVKDKEKRDEYHFKSKDKDIIRELITINKEYSDKIELLLNNLKNLEIDNSNKKIEIDDYEEKLKDFKDKVDYIEKLEKRGLIDRINNKIDFTEKLIYPEKENLYRDWIK
jgi:hypothetical protein